MKSAELARKIKSAWDRYLERYNSPQGLVYDWYWWAYLQGKNERDRVLN